MRALSKRRITARDPGTIAPSERSNIMTMEGSSMNQTIHCSVSTCRHHGGENNCQLEAIDVRPNCNCHSGKCDESMCGSYAKR